jgi:hypothetical protein
MLQVIMIRQQKETENKQLQPKGQPGLMPTAMHVQTLTLKP